MIERRNATWQPGLWAGAAGLGAVLFGVDPALPLSTAGAALYLVFVLALAGGLFRSIRAPYALAASGLLVLTTGAAALSPSFIQQAGASEAQRGHLLAEHTAGPGQAVTANADPQEERLIAQQLTEQNDAGGFMMALQIGGMVLLLVVASAAVFIAWRDNRAVARARDELTEANASLERRVGERTAALARATEDLATEAERTRLALEGGDVGTWSFTFSDRVLSCDDRCRDALGAEAEEVLGLEDIAARVHGDDQARVNAALREAIRTGGEGRLLAEFRIVKPDEVTRWVVIRGQTYFDHAAGRARRLRLSGTILDVTERKLAEESQTLLLRELAHRVKNILAVVQSMAALSARNHPEAAPFIEAFKGRLSALALAHTLLIGSERQAAQLTHLVRDTLRAFADHETGRIKIDVREATLRAAEAQTLALLLHELATNSVKHGALSNEAGRVFVRSRVGRESNGEGKAGAVLRLEWRESGGPPVVPPAHRGFGMTLIERAVRLQHGGTTDLDWRPEGLVAKVALPLPGATREGRRPYRRSASPRRLLRPRPRDAGAGTGSGEGAQDAP